MTAVAPETEVKLGDSLNLVAGFSSSWDAATTTGVPYFLASHQGFNRHPPIYTPTAKPRYLLSVTKHETPESLLSFVYPYVINVTPESTEPVVGAGPLVISEANRAELVEQIEKTLGVNLRNPDLRYVLVQYIKTVGTSTLPSPVTMSREWKEESSALPDGDPTEKSITSVLQFTNKWGSHFVSSVDFGDILFQAYSFTSRIYNAVIASNDFEDSPKDFQGYTAPNARHEVGHLLSIAKEAAFVESVQNGVWLDNHIGKADSIFSMFNGDENGNKALAVFRALVASVPTKFYLSNTAQLINLANVPLFLNVQTSVLIAKAGAPFVINTFIIPSLPKEYTGTFSPPSSLTPVTSLIFTPQVSLFQEIFDATTYLNSSVAPEKARSVIFLSNVFRATDRIVIPGEQVIIISGLLYGAGTPYTKTNVAEIVVSDSAFDAGNFYFQNTIGNVDLSTASGKRMLISSNNLAFSIQLDQSTGRNGVVLKKLQTQLPAGLLDNKVPATSFNTGADRLAVLFDTSFTTVSMNLIKTTVNPPVLQDYLAFVATLIPHDSSNQALVTSRTRALALRGSITNLDQAVMLVPYEQYDQYKDQVRALKDVARDIQGKLQYAQSSIQLRRAEERIFDVASQLNENIKKTGQLVAGLIDATASNQDQLEGYYASLATKTQQALTATEANVLRLDGLIKDSKLTLDDLVRNIKIEWNNWIIQQKVKLAFQIVGAIFSIGFTVAEMALTEDPTKIFELLQKFQELMETVKKLSETISSQGEPSSAMGEGKELLHGSLSDLPTDDEFQRLHVFLRDVFQDAPEDLSSLPKWAPAVEILMINGVAWTKAITEREALRLELYKNKEMQRISGDFKENLRKQTEKYDVQDLKQLDVDNIDLIGVTDYLTFILSRTCQQLANTLNTQSIAVQYQYLAKRVPITRFDLGSLLQVSADIEESIHVAKAALQPAPSPLAPITLNYPILETQLQLGAVKNLDIPISIPDFYNYVMVRVEEAMFSVKGVKSTDSGNYELEVTFTGDSFADRDLDREIRVFKSIPRTYSYIYDVETGKLVHGGPGPISPDLTRVTPFETWSVRFPQNRNNQGIKFEDKPELEIVFKTNCIAKTPANRMLGVRSTYNGEAFHAEQAAVLAAPAFASRTAQYAATAGPVTKEDVLTQLSVASVMKGWDCVMCMDMQKVNKILALQYDTPEFKDIPRTVFQTETVHEADTSEPDITLTIRIDAHFYVGPAKAVFLEGENGKLQLEFEIYEKDPNSNDTSSHVREIIAPEGYTRPARKYPVEAGTTFTTIVPIEAVTGDVSDSLNVILNMKFATNSSYTFMRNGVITNDKVLANSVTQIFYKNGYQYLFVKINQKPNNAIPQLVPKFFRFSSYKAHNRYVLNTYIATTSTPPQKPEFGISFPLPDVTYIDCCMFINNRIAFRKILAEGFKKSKDWQVKINEASGETDFDSISCSTQVFLDVDFPKVSDISVPSNKITLPMGDYTPEKPRAPGLRIGAKKGQFDMVVSLKTNFDQNYSFKDESQGTTNISVNFDDVPISIDVEALAASNVKLKYNLHSTNMTVSSEIKIDKGCCGSESNDEASEQLSTNLRKYFPDKMTEALNEVEFDSVSVLVLQSLLFPASYMKLNAANNPGDIVLWGELSTTK